MKKLLILLAVASLALPLAANAQIYKWKDKDGVTRYSDVPPPTNVPYKSLDGRKEVSAEPQPAAGEVVIPPAPVIADGPPKTTRQEAVVDPKEEARVKQEQEKVRKENCATARSNLNTFQQGGRISKMNEKGEREYYDDAGIAKNLEQAKQDVAKYCN